MATIYDVAKMAGVSISTVSNYLNKKYVGQARSQAIQNAIDALSYTPNRIARNLKINTSNTVMLILPNLGEKVYSEIAAGVAGYLSSRHFTLSLELSNDYPERERELISSCINSQFAGVLLCTCDPGNTNGFLQLRERRPLVFLMRKPENLPDYSFLGFDNHEIVYRLTSFLLEQGQQSLGLWTGPRCFSSEEACAAAFAEAHQRLELPVREEFVVFLPTTKELVFRSATKMFDSGVFPRFIISSSKLIADAIVEAAYFQNIILNQRLFILSLGEERWYNTEQLRSIISTMRPAQKLGMEAAADLLSNIASPVVYEQRQRQFKDEFSFTKLRELLDKTKPRTQRAKNQPTIRLLFAQTESSVSAIKYLLPHFSNHYDIGVEVHELPANELMPYYRKVNAEKSQEPDIFHVDCPWLPHLTSQGAVLDITDRIGAQFGLREKLIPGSFESISMVNGRIYGFPMLYCSQLLFYRSDLLCDPVLQNDFEAKYRRPLRPPTDWFEFNLVARYFTQKFHPASPVKYGSVMGTQFPELLMADVFPRIWAYGGSVFDPSGQVSLYSDETIQAYKNYVECLDYCNPDHPHLGTPQYIQKFAEGNTAMIVAFSNHASGIMDRSTSRVFGKSAFCPIPGGTSVLGGWNMCINRHSRNADIALKLMNWVASTQISTPYTILGGGSTRDSIFSNSELLAMYPWLPLSKQQFQTGRARAIPPQNGRGDVSESMVEDILAQVALDAIHKLQDVSVLVRRADRQLRAYFQDREPV